jgi:hypothetical protein
MLSYLGSLEGHFFILLGSIKRSSILFNVYHFHLNLFYLRAPHEVLEAQYPKLDGVGILRPNTHYYITKVIVPALDRCLSLIGADVMKW